VRDTDRDSRLGGLLRRLRPGSIAAFAVEPPIDSGGSARSIFPGRLSLDSARQSGVGHPISDEKSYIESLSSDGAHQRSGARQRSGERLISSDGAAAAIAAVTTVGVVAEVCDGLATSLSAADTGALIDVIRFSIARVHGVHVSRDGVVLVRSRTAPKTTR